MSPRAVGYIPVPPELPRYLDGLSYAEWLRIVWPTPPSALVPAGRAANDVGGHEPRSVAR